jgi:uncharacterized protein YkwD
LFVRRISLAGLALIACSTSVSAASYLSRSSNDMSARLLYSHNMERMRMHAAPLQWDPGLAAAAASYGPQLARIGRLEHSPRETRPGQRENLWRGTRGAFSPEQMVGAWIAERSLFHPGVFPNVSRTGNWSDVAHYTQLIWKGTTHVGCAVYQAAQWDYLICRYSPPGNRDGSPMN